MVPLAFEVNKSSARYNLNVFILKFFFPEPGQPMVSSTKHCKEVRSWSKVEQGFNMGENTLNH